MKEIMQNPFLMDNTAAFGAPSLNEIKPEHYMPAFEQGLRQHKTEIAAIIENSEEPNFINSIVALETSGNALSKVLNVLSNLCSAHTNDKLQALESNIFPRYAAHNSEILLNEALFDRIYAVYKERDTLELDAEDLMLLEKTYKGFKRAGAGLEENKRNELKAISEEMAGLTVKFGQNVLADTNAPALILNADDLDGLPEDVRASAAAEANFRDEQGKYVFTCSRSSVTPFLQFSERRDLREVFYNAWIHLGDNGDKRDTKKLISRIASLRVRAANLLGHQSHADFMLEDRMAGTPGAVHDLLHKLWTPALSRAKREAEVMQQRIQADGHNFKLAAWDWWFYAEKVRKEMFDLNTDDSKPYFKLENVRDGVFRCAKNLYGLSFSKVENVSVYHPDVDVYEVTDADGSHIGLLMTDFYMRPSKRGGAWMSSFRRQHKINAGQRPIVINVCNFPKSANGTPSLLDMDEVRTLFHEFGHALHGLLTNTKYESLSGTSVKRDFVELPSQIMEHWATEPEVLKDYAHHYETGAIIPDELIRKLGNADKFNQGFLTTEYLAASFLDLAWHELKTGEEQNVTEFQQQAMQTIDLIPEIAPRYASTYFQHVFSGGYSAGYYSYIWAEVLDADGYDAFREKGIFDPETAKSFRENILEMGGTVEPMELFKRFRGQEPKIEPLLEARGLV